MKKKENNISVIIYMIVLILLLIVSIILGALMFFEIQNYFKPMNYILLSGFLGLIFGFFITPLMKKFILSHQKRLTDYNTLRIIWIVISVFYFIELGALINNNFSEIRYCDDYRIVRKIKLKGYRSTTYKVEVNINGTLFAINCKKVFFENVKYEEKVNVCFYNGLLGYDFLRLPDDN